MKELIDKLRFHNDPRLYQEADLLMYDAANLIESQAAEIERLSALCDKWNFECDDMREDNKRLEAEIHHWKNNHETEVRRARVLKERTDMPIERVRAYEQWGKDLAEIERLKALCDQLGAALEITLTEIKSWRDDAFCDDFNSPDVNEALAAWRASQ